MPLPRLSKRSSPQQQPQRQQRRQFSPGVIKGGVLHLHRYKWPWIWSHTFEPNGSLQRCVRTKLLDRQTFCLQLGTEDGRLVTFVPRTIRQIITSSAEKDGTITVGARRQLKKNEEIRKCAKVKIIDQPADDLFEVEDNSVDVVISLQCAQRMIDNGRDWKKAVREACRVLKPGGRLLWVEQTTLNGESYLSYLENLYTQTSGADKSTTTEEGPEGVVSSPTLYPTFDDIGWDDVNLVLIPHTAGVAVKAFDPSAIETEEQKEKARMDDLSLTAFERGIKKRKKKKKKKTGEELAK